MVAPTREGEHEDQTFKVILSHIICSRLKNKSVPIRQEETARGTPLPVLIGRGRQTDKAQGLHNPGIGKPRKEDCHSWPQPLKW